MNTPERPKVRGVGSNQHQDKPPSLSTSAADATATGRAASAIADVDPFNAPVRDTADEAAHGALANKILELQHAAIRTRRTPGSIDRVRVAAQEDRDDYSAMMDIVGSAPSFRDAADQLTAVADGRWDKNTARSRRSYHRHATVLSKCDPEWMERSDRDRLAAGGLTASKYRDEWQRVADVESAAVYNSFNIDPNDPIGQKDLVAERSAELADQARDLRAAKEHELAQAEEDGNVVTRGDTEDHEATRAWYRDMENQITDLARVEAAVNKIRSEITDPRTPTDERRGHARRLADAASLVGFYYQPSWSADLDTIAQFGSYSPVGRPRYDDPSEPF